MCLVEIDCVRGCPGPVCVAELSLCAWLSLFCVRG